MDYSFLSKTNIFSGITVNEIKSLIKCINAIEKIYEKDDIILHAGNSCECMGLVISGSVNIIANYYWGGSNIFGHVTAGRIFAEAYSLLSGNELLCDVSAAEKTSVLFMNTKKILAVCKNACPSHILLMQNLIKISAQKNLSLSSRMMHTASKRIRDRLLSYLSEQAFLSGSNQFTVPFSRQQLADYLGTERSALSGELSKMRRDGLIDYNKNRFVLLNKQIAKSTQKKDRTLRSSC